ncbi:MAG: glutamate 5-kinase [Lachnospiraceae bacterium]|nr:glutamate 5-kinase [Lachnospiraceae bacterium]
MKNKREDLKFKKRIVVKIGSSSLQHAQTGGMDYARMEKLVRELCNLKNRGMDVILVSSGAIAAGRNAVNMKAHRTGCGAMTMAEKQACSAIGQARLMMTYQKLFGEYNQLTAQILMTKNTVLDDTNRINAINTFTELMDMGAIPVVNENDTVATHEIEIGDNDTLSAIVSAMVGADLLILLSDIKGLYTDDPRKNPDAKLLDTVEDLTDEILEMGKGSTGSSVGTGGMNTKLTAAQIATRSGADMIICSSEDLGILNRLIDGSNEGTIFLSDPEDDFNLPGFIRNIHHD